MPSRRVGGGTRRGSPFVQNHAIRSLNSLHEASANAFRFRQITSVSYARGSQPEGCISCPGIHWPLIKKNTLNHHFINPAQLSKNVCKTMLELWGRDALVGCTLFGTTEIIEPTEIDLVSLDSLVRLSALAATGPKACDQQHHRTRTHLHRQLCRRSRAPMLKCVTFELTVCSKRVREYERVLLLHHRRAHISLQYPSCSAPPTLACHLSRALEFLAVRRSYERP